jgi:hypothetical protein
MISNRSSGYFCCIAFIASDSHCGGGDCHQPHTKGQLSDKQDGRREAKAKLTHGMLIGLVITLLGAGPGLCGFASCIGEAGGPAAAGGGGGRLFPLYCTLIANGDSDALDVLDAGEGGALASSARASGASAFAGGGESLGASSPLDRGASAELSTAGDEGATTTAAAAFCARPAPPFFRTVVLTTSTSCLRLIWTSGSVLYSTGLGLRCRCQNFPGQSALINTNSTRQNRKNAPQAPHCDLSPSGPFLLPIAMLSRHPRFEQRQTPSMKFACCPSIHSFSFASLSSSFALFAVTALALLSGGAAAAAALVVATAWSDAASEVGGADAASIAVHGVGATT